MRRFLFTLLCGLGCLGCVFVVRAAHAQPDLDAVPEHQYTLTATLDPATHQITGRAEIRWTNTSREPASELLFHLYLNAFEHEETVFMQESGGRLRGDAFVGEGHIDLESLTLVGPSGPHDLLATANRELEPGDHTQLRVSLPNPVLPGESIRLEAQFLSVLPPLFARSGYHEQFHMVAQWFPILARREADGTWASFPYHGFGEFYADFARYELEVHVPAGWIVGATGDWLGEENRGDSNVHRFVADRVHDCAFATAPWLLDRSVWLRPEVRGDRLQYEPTDRDDPAALRVRILSPPGYEAAVQRHLDVTQVGLSRYGSLYGEYPYKSLTIIVPPPGASGAAGMEYPMLFVTAGPWWTTEHLPFGAPMALHDEVTAHELGHQWFQGLVASNEVRWPMLDEGLTEWITSDLLAAEHGTGSGFSAPMFRASNFELYRLFAFRGSPTPPPGRAAFEFHSSGAYGRSVYARSATIWETVARTWGRDRFHAALGAYAREWRFRHPTPDALFQAMDNEYGSWMSHRILRPALMEGEAAARQITIETDPNGGWRVRGLREGGLPLPTKVHVYVNQTRQVFDWPGSDRTFEARFSSRPTAAIVDPHRHALLDANRGDDAVGDDAGHSYFPRLTWILQTLFGALGP